METKSKLILQTHHSLTHSLTHESHSLTNLSLTNISLTNPSLTNISLMNISRISHSWISLTNLTHESLTHSWISLTNLTHESHSRILFMNFWSDTFISKVWNFPCNRQSHESYNQCSHIHADIREHITLNPYITDPVCGNLLYPDGFPHTGPAMQQASITLLFVQQLFQANLENIKATTLLSPCVGNPTLSVGIRAHWDHQL